MSCTTPITVPIGLATRVKFLSTSADVVEVLVSPSIQPDKVTTMVVARIKVIAVDNLFFLNMCSPLLEKFMNVYGKNHF